MLGSRALLDGDDVIYLVGDETIIRACPGRQRTLRRIRSPLQAVISTEIVEMDDSPVEAIRNKPDSSIAVMCKLAAKGEADVVISAGNTGACVAAAQLPDAHAAGREPAGHRRDHADISRPGGRSAMWAPTSRPSPASAAIRDHGRRVCDRGRAAFRTLASACFRSARKTPRARTTVKEARKLMRDEPQINFVGNVEGRDLFKGVVDVVVCDGFVGNIVLKFSEGMAEGMFQTIIAELGTPTRRWLTVQADDEEDLLSNTTGRNTAERRCWAWAVMPDLPRPVREPGDQERDPRRQATGRSAASRIRADRRGDRREHPRRAKT